MRPRIKLLAWSSVCVRNYRRVLSSQTAESKVTNVKFLFADRKEPAAGIDFVTIFAPKATQLAQFIRISHIENPAPCTIYFDPISHFLWRVMAIHGKPEWSAADLPCKPPRLSRNVMVEEVERAWKHLMDVPLDTLEDGARRRVSSAMAILAAIGR